MLLPSSGIAGYHVDGSRVASEKNAQRGILTPQPGRVTYLIIMIWVLNPGSQDLSRKEFLGGFKFNFVVIITTIKRSLSCTEDTIAGKLHEESPSDICCPHYQDHGFPSL